jgi:hypothetical protein
MDIRCAGSRPQVCANSERGNKLRIKEIAPASVEDEGTRAKRPGEACGASESNIEWRSVSPDHAGALKTFPSDD